MDFFFLLDLLSWLRWKHASTEPSQIDTTGNTPFKNGQFSPVFRASACVYYPTRWRVVCNFCAVCKPSHCLKDFQANSLLFISTVVPENATKVFLLFTCVVSSLWSGEYDLKLGPQGQSSFPRPPAGLGRTKAPLSWAVKRLWSPHRAIPVADKFPVSSLRRAQCLLLIYRWHVC